MYEEDMVPHPRCPPGTKTESSQVLSVVLAQPTINTLYCELSFCTLKITICPYTYVYYIYTLPVLNLITEIYHTPFSMKYVCLSIEVSIRS